VTRIYSSSVGLNPNNLHLEFRPTEDSGNHDLPHLKVLTLPFPTAVVPLATPKGVLQLLHTHLVYGPICILLLSDVFLCLLRSALLCSRSTLSAKSDDWQIRTFDWQADQRSSVRPELNLRA
jgi:hypothetical protein